MDLFDDLVRIYFLDCNFLSSECQNFATNDIYLDEHYLE